MQLIKIIVLGLLVGLLLFIVACGDDEPDVKPQIAYHSSDINSAETWNSDTLQIVTTPITVSSTLTINAGTKIEFSSGAGLTVSSTGKIIANSSSDTIYFTTSDTDASKGFWSGITIKSSENSIFNNCVFRYGGITDDALISVESGSVSIKNSVIEQSNGAGIYIKDNVSNISYSGLTIQNCALPIELYLKSIELVAPANFIDNTENKISVLVGNSGRLTEDLNIKTCSIPYKLTGAFYLYPESGHTAVLTVDSGVIIEMPSSAYIKLYVNSGLITRGTEDNEVVFTSSQSTPAAGDWDGIEITSNVIDTCCILNYTTIEYAGNDDISLKQEGINIDQARITIQNCKFNNNQGYGIRVIKGNDGTFGSFFKNTYSNNTKGSSLFTEYGSNLIGVWYDTILFSYGSIKRYDTIFITINDTDCNGYYVKQASTNEHKFQVSYDISDGDSLVMVFRETGSDNLYTFNENDFITYNFTYSDTTGFLYLTPVYTNVAMLDTQPYIMNKKM